MVKHSLSGRAGTVLAVILTVLGLAFAVLWVRGSARYYDEMDIGLKGKEWAVQSCQGDLKLIRRIDAIPVSGFNYDSGRLKEGYWIMWPPATSSRLPVHFDSGFSLFGNYGEYRMLVFSEGFFGILFGSLACVLWAYRRFRRSSSNARGFTVTPI